MLFGYWCMYCAAFSFAGLSYWLEATEGLWNS